MGQHVGRVIALSFEPFYNPNGRSLLAREQRPLAAIARPDVVGYVERIDAQFLCATAT